ncbi:hypothetical protein N7462_004519 [Penicillium macrosclerotiorum]|uniref:uncharacterized protein n=1 Tax=Penicillium macrosclerotiorum TaxID=303699 RepID=UPI002548A643|nr:uncharacterized protein N7462_004519 [Penicillium macrosclerotiorum]KAJ5690127.1 hypothetical protein N7462_004519 [Penicillium macrosclerotiorum]
MQFSDWAHAFPRPRFNRVMKPRSAGNSPSSASKRRTTTQSLMHAMPSQYHPSSLGAALLASAYRNSRPISWHPSSARARGLSNPSCMPALTSGNFADMSTMSNQVMNGLSLYGQENMMSYPVSAGPAYSPDYLSAFSDLQEPLPLSQQTPSLAMTGSQVEPMAWGMPATNSDLQTMGQTASDAWSLDMLSMANNIPPAETTCPSYVSVPSPGEVSGPSTPDFLPIQQFDSSPMLSQKEGKPEEELVGMGLYSQPNSSLGLAHQGALGKGLKLEETFSPSDDEKDDSSQYGEDDVIDPELTQPSFEEPSPPAQQSTFPISKQSSKQALNLLHKSFFFDHDDLDQQTMTAAQPFATLNKPCMSYGYGWI